MPMPTPQEWFSRNRDQVQYVQNKQEDLPEATEADKRAAGITAPTIANPKTKEEFDKLPDGTFYIEPEDGHIYQKGNKTRPKPSQPKGTLT